MFFGRVATRIVEDPGVAPVEAVRERVHGVLCAGRGAEAVLMGECIGEGIRREGKGNEDGEEDYVIHITFEVEGNRFRPLIV